MVSPRYLDLDLDLEQVARQDKRYRARTSPPAEAWGSSRQKKKEKKEKKNNATEKQDHHVPQSKASDKCEKFVVVECDVLRSVQVVVEVVVLDVERKK